MLTFHGTFRSCVDTQSWHVVGGDRGTDVHDRPCLALAHRWQHALDRAQRAEEIGVEDGVDLIEAINRHKKV